MIKIGMMIGDRYEILEKIGTGGMSDVYKAKCHKLNRLVAVKVLKQEFSENANFVSKFKVEAQAAAGLMHPNIVNVYDVGEENGIYFIVMELVEGLTLKKYIEKKARLSVKESLTIATQICMGIEAAHNNHIIHRDIKPQNVIISKEGKVKVTDFGIAKAATSNTITSNVMGSVHYTSPEQARGGFSDEKSDIYSLGITLFEMITGRVPFNGDTTVAIAIKQIQEPMPSPREFVPEIPLSVEQIVLKCTQKSPDRRYQSMSELIDDLRHSYTNPDDDFVKIQSEDEFAPTRNLTSDEVEEVRRTVHNNEGITVELPKAVNPEIEDYEYDPKMEKITTVLTIAVGVIIIVVAILLIGKTIGVFRLSKDSKLSVSTSAIKTGKVVVPELGDYTVDAAAAELEKKGLTYKIAYISDSNYEVGKVISTDPKGGINVETGTEITLNVCGGANMVKVPNVVGKTSEEANAEIISSGLKVNIQEEHSSEVEKGYVISQDPDPSVSESAPELSTVTIVVSSGPSIVEFRIPDFVGLTEEAAIVSIEGSGLLIGEKKYEFSEEYPKGTVMSQSIEKDTVVKEGDVLDIVISLGSEADSDGKYCFNGNILAPTTAEDADYSSGTEVHIVITTISGQTIFDTKTTSFPVAVNVWNILGNNRGTITMTYEVEMEAHYITDETTGETVLVPGGKQQRKIVREVEFAVMDE